MPPVAVIEVLPLVVVVVELPLSGGRSTPVSATGSTSVGVAVPAPVRIGMIWEVCKRTGVPPCGLGASNTSVTRIARGGPSKLLPSGLAPLPSHVESHPLVPSKYSNVTSLTSGAITDWASVVGSGVTLFHTPSAVTQGSSWRQSPPLVPSQYRTCRRSLVFCWVLSAGCDRKPGTVREVGARLTNSVSSLSVPTSPDWNGTSAPPF